MAFDIDVDDKGVKHMKAAEPLDWTDEMLLDAATAKIRTDETTGKWSDDGREFTRSKT